MLAGSILYKLKAAHLSGQAGKRPLNFGVYYKNTLVELCHALEDAILVSASTQPLMITAFQQGKWYLQEANRYGEIATKAQQIVIMAAAGSGFTDHPTSQCSNVALVNLDPADPVAQEWHLIILAPSYAAMVLCQELSAEDYRAIGTPENDLERKFYGFWTFEPNLVQETIELAISHIGVYNADLATQLTAQLDMITAAIPTTPPDDLCEIVPRIITYLQTSQEHASTTALDDNLTSNELQAFLRMAQIIDQTDLQSPMTAAEVATLAEAMGQLLDLPAWQLHRLRLAGLLHRLAFQASAIEASDASVTTEHLDGPVCALNPGAQALRTMNRLRAIAAIIAHQSEHWDGSGQPAGLVGEAIPLESRILGLVAHFQQQLVHDRDSNSFQRQQLGVQENLSQVLTNCQAEAGTRWDPKLVDILVLLVSGFQQGLNLSVALPKIAAGLWMMDSRSQESLLSETNLEVNPLNQTPSAEVSHA
jgi:DICT domain-containing protein